MRAAVAKHLDGLSPSDSIKSSHYRSFQETPHPIYDGRYVTDSPISTLAPPVELFHPVFASFLDAVNNTSLEVPLAILNATSRLMDIASRLHETEAERKSALEDLLSLAISQPFSLHSNVDRTRSDGVGKLFIGSPINEEAILVLREDKCKSGEGGDPVRQSNFSWAKVYCQHEVSIFLPAITHSQN
jgi:hypothetical protein